MARLLDEVTGDYRVIGRRLGNGIPSMPPGVAARVHAEVDNATRALATRSRDLPPLRDDLSRRASWAELVSAFTGTPGLIHGGSGHWSWRRAVDQWRSLTLLSPQLRRSQSPVIRRLGEAYSTASELKQAASHEVKDLTQMRQAYDVLMRRWGNQYGTGRAFITLKMGNKIARDTLKTSAGRLKAAQLGPLSILEGHQEAQEGWAEVDAGNAYKSQGVSEGAWEVNETLKIASGRASEWSGGLYTASYAVAATGVGVPVAGFLFAVATGVSAGGIALDAAHTVVDTTLKHWSACNKAWHKAGSLLGFGRKR